MPPVSAGARQRQHLTAEAAGIHEVCQVDANCRIEPAFFRQLGNGARDRENRRVKPEGIAITPEKSALVGNRNIGVLTGDAAV